MRSLSAALLAGLLFSSCAREPVSNEEPAEQRPSVQAPSAPKTGGRPVIAVLGDSLSAGFGVEPGKSFPDFLQRALDRRGYRYRVVNAGISGDTTSGGLVRLESVMALKPAIVILELGANDGLRGIPVSASRSNLEQMIVQLKGSGAQVVLAGMTLPPNYGPDYIHSFERIYTGLADKYKLPLIPFLLEGVAGTRKYMQRDGLHPTAEGNRRVAENVMKVLEPLLQQGGSGG